MRAQDSRAAGRLVESNSRGDGGPIALGSHSARAPGRSTESNHTDSTSLAEMLVLEFIARVGIAPIGRTEALVAVAQGRQ